MQSPPPTRDAETVDYFDHFAPEYSVERLAPAADFIAANAGPDSTLIDLGSGTGNTLEYLMEATGVTDVGAVDVSATYVAKTRDRIACSTYQASIFDAGLDQIVDRRFDFATVAAVLHHLIGPTRGASRRLAEAAVVNAKKLLNPGGYLIVHEPVFDPQLAMAALFYLKKGVTRLTTKRVPIGGYWNNIGAPVVSYYNGRALTEMLATGSPSDLVFSHDQDHVLNPLVRPFLQRSSLTLAVQLTR